MIFKEHDEYQKSLEHLLQDLKTGAEQNKKQVLSYLFLHMRCIPVSCVMDTAFSLSTRLAK